MEVRRLLDRGDAGATTRSSPRDDHPAAHQEVEGAVLGGDDADLLEELQDVRAQPVFGDLPGLNPEDVHPRVLHLPPARLRGRLPGHLPGR